MKAFGHIVIMVLLGYACFGQTNVASRPKTVHALTNLSDSALKSISTTRTRKPFAVLTLTNDISQETVLAVTDRVNADYGIDQYVDGYCGFGALLSRDYLGRGYLVTVSFAWDQRPKRTVISLHGTNAGLAAAWCKDMAKALRGKFGEIFDDGEKK